MAKLNPYLMFRGEAREALDFYRSVLGGELTVTTFGEFGMGGEHGAPEDGVMHGQLDTDLGFTLMGSDIPPSMPAGESNGTVCISGDETDVLSGYFQALGEGGEVSMPLEKMAWGDHYGQLKDKFGVDWMFNIAG